MGARVQAALLPPTYTTIRDTTVVPSWHLAGIAHRNADGDHRFTPRATERLADTAFRFGVHLVFISSIAVRSGSFSHDKLNENDLLKPINASGRCGNRSEDCAASPSAPVRRLYATTITAVVPKSQIRDHDSLHRSAGGPHRPPIGASDGTDPMACHRASFGRQPWPFAPGILVRVRAQCLWLKPDMAPDRLSLRWIVWTKTTQEIWILASFRIRGSRQRAPRATDGVFHAAFWARTVLDCRGIFF